MTLQPYVTGQSVLGIKHKDGVVMACDKLLSYGSWKKYRSRSRMFTVSKHVVVCASGEFSDFQYITEQLDNLKLDKELTSSTIDGGELRPKQVWAYLNRILYNRRCKMNPLWNSVVVAGFDKAADKPEDAFFLGYCDLFGTRYEDSVVATAFGSYFGIPKMRSAAEDKELAQSDAKKVLRDSMATLCARDCNASGEIEYAIITKDGITIETEQDVNGNWDIEGFEIPSIKFDIAGSTW